VDTNRFGTSPTKTEQLAQKEDEVEKQEQKVELEETEQEET